MYLGNVIKASYCMMCPVFFVALLYENLTNTIHKIWSQYLNPVQSYGEKEVSYKCGAQTAILNLMPSKK